MSQPNSSEPSEKAVPEPTRLQKGYSHLMSGQLTSALELLSTPIAALFLVLQVLWAANLLPTFMGWAFIVITALVTRNLVFPSQTVVAPATNGVGANPFNVNISDPVAAAPKENVRLYRSSAFVQMTFAACNPASIAVCFISRKGHIGFIPTCLVVVMIAMNSTIMLYYAYKRAEGEQTAANMNSGYTQTHSTYGRPPVRTGLQRNPPFQRPQPVRPGMAPSAAQLNSKLGEINSMRSNAPASRRPTGLRSMFGRGPSVAEKKQEAIIAQAGPDDVPPPATGGLRHSPPAARPAVAFGMGAKTPSAPRPKATAFEIPPSPNFGAPPVQPRRPPPLRRGTGSAVGGGNWRNALKG